MPYLLPSNRLHRASLAWAMLPVSDAPTRIRKQRVAAVRALLKWLFFHLDPTGAVFLLSTAAEALNWSRAEDSSPLGGQVKGWAVYSLA
jgi:hypothetical protein